MLWFLNIPHLFTPSSRLVDSLATRLRLRESKFQHSHNTFCGESATTQFRFVHVLLSFGVGPSGTDVRQQGAAALYSRTPEPRSKYITSGSKYKFRVSLHHCDITSLLCGIHIEHRNSELCKTCAAAWWVHFFSASGLGYCGKNLT